MRVNSPLTIGDSVFVSGEGTVYMKGESSHEMAEVRCQPNGISSHVYVASYIANSQIPKLNSAYALCLTVNWLGCQPDYSFIIQCIYVELSVIGILHHRHGNRDACYQCFHLSCSEQ